MHKLEKMGPTLIKKLTQHRVMLALSLLFIVLAFTPVALLSLIGFTVLTAYYWPLSNSVQSRFLRLIVGFVVGFCFTLLVAVTYWLIGFDLTIASTVIPGFILLSVITMFTRRSEKVALITRSDVVSLVIAGVSVAVIVGGLLLGNQGTLTQKLLQQVTTGYDTTQHVSLTLTLLDNKGFVWGPPEEVLDKVQYHNLASYPQGWSLSSSLWWQGIDSHLNILQDITKVLFMFFVTTMFWYGLLIFMFARAILYIVEAIRKKKSDGVVYTGTVVFTVFVQFLLLIGILYNGFVSFFPALVIPLVMILFLVDLFVYKKIDVTRFMIVSLFFASGVAFSWLLAAPIALIIPALALIAYHGSLKKAFFWIIKSPLVLIVSIAIAALLSTQLYIQAAFGMDGLINWWGGSGSLNYIVMSLFLVSALVVGFVLKGSPFMTIFAVGASGGLLTSGGVYLYQFITNGGANYFSIKLTFVTLLILSVFAIAGLLILFMEKVGDKSSKMVNAVFLSSAIIFLPMASNLELGTSPILGIGAPNYAFGERFLSQTSASQVLQLIKERKVDNANFLMFKQFRYAEDVSTSHFVQMLSKKPIPICKNGIELGITDNWESVDTDYVKECVKDEDFYIITSWRTHDKLVAAFADTPNVKLILSH